MDGQEALQRIGGPVAVKISDAAVLHKSDHGGVHLGVASTGEMRVAVDGDYGPNTKRALQRRVGVKADAVVGPLTVRALRVGPRDFLRCIEDRSHLGRRVLQLQRRRRKRKARTEQRGRSGA